IVRMNLLCNPTGKPFAFRAVDWVVERNNLYTKVIFRGGGPNGTLDHIIKELPLIEVYRNCHVTMENAFHLQHRTIRHAAPDMTKTIQKLAARIKQKNPHTKKEGRSALHSIPDQIAVSMALIQEQKVVSEEDAGTFELQWLKKLSTCLRYFDCLHHCTRMDRYSQDILLWPGSTTSGLQNEPLPVGIGGHMVAL
ncbi:hypothetical protein EDB19DRAFT_1635903, partial [Suillus lakei]